MKIARLIRTCTGGLQAFAQCGAVTVKNCCGNYDIDIHNPEGSGTSHFYFAPGTYYTVPYRSLCAKDVDNLLVAGRCIGATHEAQASVRIMPICAALGQAAGTAAALALEIHTSVKAVDIQALQGRLRAAGARTD